MNYRKAKIAYIHCHYSHKQETHTHLGIILTLKVKKVTGILQVIDYPLKSITHITKNSYVLLGNRSMTF